MALFWHLCIVGTAEAQQGKAAVIELYGKLPLSFEANQGQTDSRVKFLSSGNGYSLFLTGSEAVLALAKGIQKDTRTGKGSANSPFLVQDGAILRMKLLGANAAAQVSGVDELAGKINYFIGDDPKMWRTKVPIYGRVKYSELYPGVDLIYYGNQQQLESDFVFAPNADSHAIALEIRGADRLSIDEQGDLVMLRRDGTVRLKKPVAYQEVNGERRVIAAAYQLKGKNRVGFELAKYDRSKALVIDPVLAYSTYLGGSNGDEGEHIAVDSTGSAYIAGFTLSPNFPATFGAFQTSNFSGQFGNAFVTKLSADGSTLVYSTYLGGTSGDFAMGIAVDSSGNAYVTGATGSSFPITPGSFQTTFHGGANNAFVTKLNPNGSSLVYSTYLSGSIASPAGCAGSQGNGISVDSTGAAYVIGTTSYTDFPTTAGAFQTTLHGNSNPFVTKLNAAGSGLAYSSYLGGSGGGCSGDIGKGIAVDSSGAAYVTGLTVSPDFPTTPGSFQPSWTGPAKAFVTKLNATGSGLKYSTYLGGRDGLGDSGQSISVDSSGSAYVAGVTGATTFPTTPGAFQTIYGGGNDDAFVTKLTADGSALLYSTYLGGNGIDSASGIAVDSLGLAYVTGITQSTNFPTTAGALQTTLTAPAGSNNAFVASLSAGGSSLVYSTYLGGSGSDYSNSIAVDSFGAAYLTGTTTSTNYPTTSGTFQTSQPSKSSPGLGTAFVTKIAGAVAAATSTALTTSASPTDAGDPITFTAVVSSAGGSPVGSVAFLDGSTTLAVAALTSGQASYTTSALAAGSHSVTAQFTPSSPTSFAASSSAPLTETVISLSQLAELSGGNNFTGNQFVNGNVSATAFLGNGSGLTNVTASGLSCTGCIGNVQLGINYAAGDAQGGNALNALMFGGLSPSAFASAFAPASGSGNYVAKTGDIMTGTLNLPANGLVAGTNQLLLAGGNVGIGTATPQFSLDVVGQGNFNGATNTFNSGVVQATQSSSGAGPGVTVTNLPPTAVRGDATAITNQFTHGVTGTSQSSNGRGVVGIAYSTTGGTRGVNAISYGDAGAGIAAFEVSPTGSTVGIYASSASPQGIGGQFENTVGGQILSGLSSGVEKFRVDSNGNVTAGAFFGNGSGLTNVSATNASTATNLTCTGCVGNAQLGITYAAGDAQGGNALNALMLGGLSPGAFAPASGSPNYVAKSGDTMTGALNLSSGDVSIGAGNLDLPGTNSTGTAGVIKVAGNAFLSNFGGTSTFVGTAAGNFNAANTGIQNTAIGPLALNSNTTGSFGVAVGNEALRFNTTGIANVAMGQVAMQNNSTGGYNSAVGNAALRNNSSGFGNTGTGYLTLYLNDSGNYNTAFGACALMRTYVADNQTINCAAVNSGLSAGSGNTGIGLEAGQSNFVGQANTFVGYQADARFGTLTNATALGAYAMVAESNAMVLGSINGVNGATASVNVGIGTTTPAHTLDVAGDINASSNITTGGVFTGNGAGLTNVSASSASTATSLTCTGCVGNAQLGVNYAGSASQGGSATTALQSNNALALGGIAPSGYAPATGSTVYVAKAGDTMTGNLTVPSLNASGTVSASGSLLVGNGTPILQHISILVNPSFPALKPGACATQNFTLTGGADGDTIALGVPNARMAGGGNLIYNAWVSATDTITVQACNANANAPQKAAGTGSIRVDLWKH